MIPKIIHYCWFGGGLIPDLAEKCIDSWKKYCPGYEIKRWDESNFNLDCCSYIKEAYKEKKWAFVSDFARFKILYEWGGIYFDTDVELIKPIDELASNEFMACEKCYYFSDDSWISFRKESPGMGIAVGAGLGLASEKGNLFFKEIINDYYCSSFIMEGGIIDKTTVVKRVTGLLEKYGFDRHKNEIQTVKGMTIYPTYFFAGLDNISQKIVITDDTRAIHHCAGSWVTPLEAKIIKVHKKFKGKGKIIFLIGYILFAPISLYNRIAEYGIWNYAMYVLSRIGSCNECKKNKK